MTFWIQQSAQHTFILVPISSSLCLELHFIQTIFCVNIGPHQPRVLQIDNGIDLLLHAVSSSDAQSVRELASLPYS